MGMVTNRWIFGIASVLAVGAAIAVNYGIYYCDECLLEGATPDVDTHNYIKMFVNPDVASTGWVEGDVVTICNGDTCATYLVASRAAGVAGMQQIAKFPRSMLGSGGGGGGSYEYYGGTPGGGGCTYGCDDENTGTVTVRPLERAS